MIAPRFTEALGTTGNIGVPCRAGPTGHDNFSRDLSEWLLPAIEVPLTMHRSAEVLTISILLSLLPTAFFAIIGVMCLALANYHAGEVADQGFMHGISGMRLSAIAPTIALLLDAIRSRPLEPRNQA